MGTKDRQFGKLDYSCIQNYDRICVFATDLLRRRILGFFFNVQGRA